MAKPVAHGVVTVSMTGTGAGGGLVTGGVIKALNPFAETLLPTMVTSCRGAGVGKLARTRLRTGASMLLTTSAVSPGSNRTQPPLVQTSISPSSEVTLSEPSVL